MNKAIRDIKPGYGLGVLKFGMTRNEVEQVLGQPDSIDNYSYTDTDEELTEAWEYNEANLSLNFDEEEDWKLIMMSVYSDDYLLEGKSLIGKEFEDVQVELEKMNLGEMKIEDSSTSEMPNQVLIEIQSLNFWFENGILNEIQWSPDFIDDDTIKWPV